MSQSTALLARVALILLSAAGGYVFLRWLLIPLLPFLLALALSALSEPTVGKLQRRLKTTRSFSAAVVTTATLTFVGTGTVWLSLRLWSELRSCIQNLPELLENLPALWNNILNHLDGWYISSSPLLRDALDTAAGHIAREIPSYVATVGGKVMDTLSDLASRLPDAGLFLITTVLAIYFTSLNYPAILAFLKRQLPPNWQKRCRKAAQCCRSTILKWLRAELMLIGTTFLILLAGFSWLRLDFALLAALLTALIDALPVLGTGTVLFPWAALSFLTGNTGRTIGLVTLYGIVLLVHSILEPRLLSGQAGLPPITALLAMYTGFHLFGVGGMILLPFLLLLAKQLQDAEVIRLWQ